MVTFKYTLEASAETDAEYVAMQAYLDANGITVLSPTPPVLSRTDLHGQGIGLRKIRLIYELKRELAQL